MKKTVLLTGITGFIGSAVAEAILGQVNSPLPPSEKGDEYRYRPHDLDFDITALVRPGTDKRRYERFIDKIKIVEIDLADLSRLEDFLDENKFDYILHIGALRGGRKEKDIIFIATNFNATHLLVENAIANKSKLIFCSSVGVYGAIPQELPATLKTPYQKDNLYHMTKILCEQMIISEIQKGKLDACIVRPAITYGTDDYGFPYTLTKLVHKKMLYLPQDKVYIHLTNVSLLVDVFVGLLHKKYFTGKIYNVADREKVCLHELVDYISMQLHNQKYPKSRYISKSFFSILTTLAKLIRSDLWTSRFQLISNDWHYDVTDTYKDFELKEYKTIPEFKVTIDWYFEEFRV